MVERTRDGAPWSIEFSPDSRLVAVTAPTHSLALTDIATNTDVEEIRSGYHTTFSSDSQFIASTFGAFWNDENHTVVLWNTATKQKVFERQIKGYTDLVGLLKDNKTIIVSNGENIFFYDFTNNSEIQRYEGSSAILSPSKDSIAVVLGGVVSVRQLVDKAQSELIVAQNSVIDRASFSNDDRYLATFDNDIITIWETENGNAVKQIKNASPIRKIAFNSDHDTLSTLDLKGLVQVWDVASGKLVRKFQADIAINNSYNRENVQFSQDANVITITGENNNISVWSIIEGREIGRFKEDSTFAATYLTPKGYNLFIGHSNGSVTQYELTGHSLIRDMAAPTGDFEPSISSIVISNDGKHIAIGMGIGSSLIGGNVVVRDLDSGDIVSQYNPLGALDSMEISSDRHYIAMVGAEIPHMISASTYNASVWQLDVQKQLFIFGPSADLTGSSPNANSIVFSPDSKYIAVGLADGSTHIWSIEQNQEIANIIEANPVGRVLFSHSGKYIGVVDQVGGVLTNSRVSIWRPEDLIETACQRLSRNFTEQEWNQYFANEPYQQTCTNLPAAPTTQP